MEECEYYIHDTLIAANSWANDTWNWLMGVIGRSGDTLVDIVGDIWTGIGTAISLVKSAGSVLVNIVKAGLSFIANSVLGPIIDDFVLSFQLILKTIGYLIDEVMDIPQLSVTILSDGIELNEISIRIYKDNLDVILDVDSFKLELNGLFIYPTVKFETLSAGLDASNTVQNWNLATFVVFLVAHITAEFGIIKGYKGEDLIVSTFRSSISNLQDSPIHYTELDAPGGLWAYYFTRKEFEPNEQTDRQALERGLKIAKGDKISSLVGTPTEEWKEEELEFISGPKAFGIWAKNIENREFNVKGHSYVIGCYNEGRLAVVKFLGRLIDKYPNTKFVMELSKLQSKYKEISSKFGWLYKNFPFPEGNLNEVILNETSVKLKEIMHLEFQAIELVEETLKIWK